jgi:hypothetical protein
VISILSSCPVPGAIAGHLPLASSQVGTIAEALAEGIIAALMVLVIWPAVWSRLEWRREAAKEVLDSILQAVIKALKIGPRPGEDEDEQVQDHEAD